MSSETKDARRTAEDVPLAVQWHDGMQLSPQHFQESFHRVARYIDFHLDLATPFHYGVIGRVNFGGLATGFLRVVDLEAVMPDDTIIRQTGQDPELGVSLRAHAEKMKVVPATIYLAVPKEYPGRSVDGELARYRSIDGPMVPDENTGDNAIRIPRLVPKTSLLIVEDGAEPETRFVSMPIAKVRSEGDSFTLVANYIPPCMVTSKGGPLGDLCRGIIESLREKANRLADRMLELSLTTDRELIGTMRQQIKALVSAVPPFEVLLETGQAHPFQLYVALAGVLGSVAGLAKNPVPPPLKPYDHDDIHGVFLDARVHIETIVKEGILESFNAHPFDIANGRFRVDFNPSWQGRKLVLAAKARRGVRESDLINWMKGALVGSLNKAAEMQEARVTGISRAEVREIDGLVASSTTFLFKLDVPSPYLELGVPLAVFNTADPSATNGPSELILYVKSTREDVRGK